MEFKVLQNERLGEVRAVIINDEFYFIAKDIASSLGYKDPKNTIKNQCQNRILVSIPHPQNNKKMLKVNAIPKSDLLTLILHSQKYSEIEKKNIINSLVSSNILDENICVLHSRKEIEFKNKLYEFFDALNIDVVHQYNILDKYIVDFYIPLYNVVIEYDENGHKYYLYENEQLREENITKHLHCTFIRIKESDTDEYNLGIIMKKLLERKIFGDVA